MSIYYKYAPDGSKTVVLYYVDIFLLVYKWRSLKIVCWYLGKEIPCEILEICTLVHINKNFSIKGSFHFYGSGYICHFYCWKILGHCHSEGKKKFYKTTLPDDMVFTKKYVSTSDGQVKKLTREYNIHYRACIGSLIYLLSTRVYLNFSVHKVAKFLANPG